MSRPRRIFLWIVVAMVAVFAVDRVWSGVKKRRALDPVFRFGGTCHSIPFEPIGTEYVVSFDRPLTVDELDQLVELNSLRGSVSVYFNCTLTSEQVEQAERRLPKCQVYVDDSGMNQR